MPQAILVREKTPKERLNSMVACSALGVVGGTIGGMLANVVLEAMNIGGAEEAVDEGKDMLLSATRGAVSGAVLGGAIGLSHKWTDRITTDISVGDQGPSRG